MLSTSSMALDDIEDCDTPPNDKNTNAAAFFALAEASNPSVVGMNKGSFKVKRSMSFREMKEAQRIAETINSKPL